MEETQYNIPIAEKQPPKRWGLWLFIPLMLGMIALFILSLEWRETLKVQRIIVYGSHLLRSQDVNALVNVPLKAPMFEVNLLSVQKKLASQPFIKEVSVNRQFPDGLRIEVVERRPVASISGAELRYVDAEGVILPYIQSPVQLDLPMISGIKGAEKIVPGKTLSSSELFQALEILQAAIAIDSTVYHLISEVKMNSGNDIVLYAAEGGVPIILGKGDVAPKLLLFQTFWNNFIRTGDPEKLRYIDLRFDGQVVVKWNQQPENQSSKLSL
jgi:cell division protein FtsQ